MNTDNLSQISLARLKGYVIAAIDLGQGDRLSFQEVYDALESRSLLAMLTGELGNGIERVWFPRGSWEEVEFYATLTCLRLHTEGREGRTLDVGTNGLRLLCALIDLIVQYMDCGRLDELQQATYKALEAGPTMLMETDESRWLLANPFVPLPT